VALVRERTIPTVGIVTDTLYTTNLWCWNADKEAPGH